MDIGVVLHIIWKRLLEKRKLGIIFSVLITVSFGLVFNSVQANTITFAFEQVFWS